LNENPFIFYLNFIYFQIIYADQINIITCNSITYLESISR